MKMATVEKWFVNSLSHSRRVSAHAEKLLELVNFEAGHRYLDVGCGNGVAPIYLAQKYHLDITGIDVDPDQIRSAQAQSAEMLNVRFFTVDSTQLPFEDGEFDIVFTNKVMHHIPNWQVALAEMVRVLRPGGYLIYSDLVYPGWLAAIGSFAAKDYAGFPTFEALRSFIQENELSKIYSSKSLMHFESVFQKKGLDRIQEHYMADVAGVEERRDVETTLA